MSQSRLTPDRLSLPFEGPSDHLKLPQVLPNTSQAKINSRFEFTTSPKFLYKNSSLGIFKGPQSLPPTLGITESTQATSVRPFKLRRPVNPKTIFQSLELDTPSIPKDDTEYYRKGLNTPYKNEQISSRDEQTQRILGREAVNSFYTHYKKLDRVKEINLHLPCQDAVYTNFLSKSESLCLFPSKIGFLRERIDEKNGDSEAKLKIKYLNIVILNC
jgi:hypothetical protein